MNDQERAACLAAGMHHASGASVTCETGPVPAIAHFVWLGTSLPWFAQMAIRSARARGGFGRLILHHEARLESSAIVDELRALDDVELRVLDETALFEKLQAEGLPSFSKVYAGLVAPAARANLLRLAILGLEGGVYIDMDTLTVRDFSELRRRAPAFVGIEHILHPGAEAGANVQPGAVRSWCLQLLRTAMSRVGPGWRLALHLQHLYPAVANNAVIGATPRHPFIFDLLQRIGAMSPRKQRARFALGPHLLQAALSGDHGHVVEVLPPSVLFPLGPVVSLHWFRMRRRVPPLSALIGSDTISIHWYASSKKLIRLLPMYDDRYVRAHRDVQLYSRIACAILDDSLDAELER